MKSKSWTLMEDQIIRSEWARRPADEVAAMVGRSIKAVQIRASKLGVKKDHYGIVWTPDQLKLLRDYFPTMFNKPLAKWIGVSLRTMIRKARELGLEKKPGFLDERRRDIQALASAALKKSTNTSTRFKKGMRNNPAGEFKPGYKESPETKAKRIASIKCTWKYRKARMELDKNLHPENYFKTTTL